MRKSKKRRNGEWRFIVPGQPRGYVSRNRNSGWSKTYKRTVAYMDLVRECAAVAGVPLPLKATKENPLMINVIAYFQNGVHCDPENVRKAVADGLCYDVEKRRKGDDKHTGAQFPPPRYSKTNPRTVVIIKPYERKKRPS